MRETFCTDVADCSAFECNDLLCWDGFILRPNIPQWVSILLYFVFRTSEGVIFAYLGQINRELLQLTVTERKRVTACCCMRGHILPTGIYWQVLLRFLGTFIGVLSFILILERNIIMFILLIVIDSGGVGLLSVYQHKDIWSTQSELAKMQMSDDTVEEADDLGEGYLSESGKKDVPRTLLKFL